jgi:uracil-DNA glycosylase
MFHPSYLMRQAMKKKLAWQDLLNIKEFISK